MYLNRRPKQSSARGIAALGTALLVGALGVPFAVQAQDPPAPFTTPLPMCYAPPGPDTWPQAVIDTLGSTAGVPVAFSGAGLTANDSGASVSVRSVASSSSKGGTITGSGPYTYTPLPGYIGGDVFTYEIGDAADQRTVGLVKIAVTRDVVLPTVSISAPLGGIVAGNVVVRASASDNVAVAGVSFYDGAAPIGSEVGAEPFEAVWNTTLTSEGSHVLKAVARDVAGNTTTASVAVDVRNNTTALVPGVVGQAQAAAVAAITGAGLTADITNVNSASAPIGSVVSQNPTGGNTVAIGSSVAVSVAIGALVPGVVGSTQAAATAAITSAGLLMGPVTTANSATAAGSVISQSLIAGTSVAPGTAMSLVVSLGPAAAPAVPTVDKMVFSQGAGRRTTPAFSTAIPGEMLVAFASSDGPASTDSQSLTISGAGLTWTRVQRSATRFGVSEIWKASAPSVLTNVTVSSTQAIAGVHQSLTVIAFTGVGGIGASNAAGAISGAPTVSLVTQAAGSLVYAAGNDWDRAVARTIPAGQTKVREFVDTPVGDTFWLQAAAGTSASAGATVTLNATAPTNDQWNMAIVELTPGVAPVNVSVPNVVGLTQTAAQAAITGASLTAGAVTNANHATVPAGQVMSQNPLPGTSVAPNSSVSLVMSLGPAAVTVPVPNVGGLAQADAQTAITTAGLTVGAVTTANHATVPAGQVISQNPVADTAVAPNSAVAIVVSLGPAVGRPLVDATVFADGTGPQTTPAFSTVAAGEVLLAFAASDGPTTGVNNQNLTVSGAGLSWTRVQRAATQRGVAEIWTATSPAALTNVTVTSTQSVTVVLGAAVNQSLTVVSFTGASGVGASSIGSAVSGAPSVSLVAQAAGSVVYAVGNDFDRAVARTIPAGQTKVHEFFAPTGDTFWVQTSNSATAAAGTTVTLNATAPTNDQWNFAIVELKR
jgi:beta-lactam-binding protein with PASTA domain